MGNNIMSRQSQFLDSLKDAIKSAVKDGELLTKLDKMTAANGCTEFEAKEFLESISKLK
jgi:predicted RNA binding protein with dsRBD fold (UPF0201 family)